MLLGWLVVSPALVLKIKKADKTLKINVLSAFLFF
jgi:hypothetical protein